MAPGINGKMSKHKAAFCFLQLNGINAVLQKRKAFDAHYRKCLSGVKGIHCLADADEKVANYSYFPILVRPEYPLSRDALYEKLRHYDIYAPRYFYSLISDFPIYRGTPSAAYSNLPVATKAGNEVTCLSSYSDLLVDNIYLILQIITNEAN